MDVSTALGSAQGDLQAMASSLSAFGNFSMLGLTVNQEEIERDDSFEDREELAKDQREKIQIAEDLKNHKTVFVNQRWQRENDMREKIRHVAEYGEKMVQKDREVDYKEDFEETDSNDSNLDYFDDSDEEFVTMKSQILEISRQKSNKKLIYAVEQNYNTNLALRDRVDRTDLKIAEGQPVKQKNAYTKDRNDEIQALKL